MRYPEGKGPFPCLLVIHGGFWRSAYDLSHISHLCQAFANEGVVTCNIEYRRVGNSGGGWPGTFQDINLATSHILNTISSDSRVDVTRTVVLGHSAGGHLALWLASRHRIPNASVLHSNTTHRHINAVSLAGVCDLRTAWREQLGGGAVAKLMGGSPTQHPDRYLAGNPIELLPIGARQVLVHGAIDDIVPFSQSERFVERAEQLGDQPDLVKLDGAGHFEPIDPESNAWSSVVKAILSQLGTG
ncbi:MAG TPA: prolyl oligopeptidase family serine peptidase [Candidatus Bathyarchaeia archaeon]|nr:prolyl oligopeptidase family serine peptidase [Candidatus Bathyarchaeia archaeon]